MTEKKYVRLYVAAELARELRVRAALAGVPQSTLAARALAAYWAAEDAAAPPESDEDSTPETGEETEE